MGGCAAQSECVRRALHKRGVLVGDAPAFVVNRVLTRMTCVLMQALEHGNSVEETDEAILRLGLPMAPSVLLQLVGPHVANQVLETLHEAFPERFPLSPTLANCLCRTVISADFCVSTPESFPPRGTMERAST